MKTNKYHLVQSWCIPLVLWIIYFGWVLFFDIIQEILSYDAWMTYIYIGFIFPIAATIWGVYWNVITLRHINQQHINKVSVCGAIFWLVCIFVFAFFVFGTESSGEDYAPIKSEIIE